MIIQIEKYINSLDTNKLNIFKPEINVGAFNIYLEGFTVLQISLINYEFLQINIKDFKTKQYIYPTVDNRFKDLYWSKYFAVNGGTCKAVMLHKCIAKLIFDVNKISKMQIFL